jgi:hypothetical protein
LAAAADRRAALLLVRARGGVVTGRWQEKARLDAGADVNEETRMPNAGTATALTNAVWAGDKEIVALLLNRGAKTEVTGGKFYRTILDYAREHSAPEIIALLEKAGPVLR